MFHLVQSRGAREGLRGRVNVIRGSREKNFDESFLSLPFHRHQRVLL